MKLILGLDLGVSSIGWAVVHEAENENETSYIDSAGVRVVPLTNDEEQNFEKGKSITTNADRAAACSARRNLQRYKLRRSNLIDCLKRNRLIRDESILYETGSNTTFETYRLRERAVNEEITLEQLARVLLMINKKRGYKSNRRAKQDDEGEAVDGMEIARRLYDEGLTPGQLTLQLLIKGKKYVPSFYRSDLQQEFDIICSEQRKYYPEVLTDDFVGKLKGRNKKATIDMFRAVHGIEATDVRGKDRLLVSFRLRAEAPIKQLGVEDVVYVLAEINGAISNSSGYLGDISDRSKELYFGHLTVGQYLMKQLACNPNYSFKNKVFYRQDYLNEFEAIWETQARFHKELTPELKHEIRDIIIFYQRRLKSKKGLVGYCELESFDKEITDPVTGRTRKLRIGQKVCPKSSPLFQEFKIWQTLQNVTVTDRQTDVVTALLPEEKEMLWQELCVREKLSKKEILVLLRGKGAERRFDLNHDGLQGNTTQSALLAKFQDIIVMSGHDVDFKKNTAEEIHTVLRSVFKSLGWNINVLKFDSALPGTELERQDSYRLWHLLYSYEGDDSKSGVEGLKRKIAKLCNIDAEYAAEIAKVTFVPDYGNLSTRAIRKILPYLRAGNVYSEACGLAGYKHSKRSLTREEIDGKQLVGQLEMLPRNSLRNPVVEKILNQMINVVNAVVSKYGNPDEIRVEMARELRNDAKKRAKMYADNLKAKAGNDEIRAKLQAVFGIANPSRKDIVRYRLYEELSSRGYRTLYSDTEIRPQDLFSNKYDIEHIIPQAMLFDDSFANKTLELRDVNIAKGNLTAMDFMEAQYNAEQYKSRILDLFKMGAISKVKKDRLLMHKEDVPADFLNRDLVNTRYIARKAVEILEGVSRSVISTTGSITARLREDWQIVDAIKELNWDKYARLGLTEIEEDRNGRSIRKIKGWTKRNDHRHHAMDAITIAFTTRGIIKYLNTLSSQGSDKLTTRLKYQYRDEHGKWRFLPPILPIGKFRAEVKGVLENILVSIKSKNKVMTQNVNKIKVKGGVKRVVQLTPRGQLHKETNYGRIWRYETRNERVGAAFDEAKIMTVADARYRTALLERLHQFEGDAKKAFTGRNSMDKNPLYTDERCLIRVPDKVKTVVLSPIFTIRKPIDKNLSVDKVIDIGIRRILQARIDEYGGSIDKAFSNLESNPIYLNREKGIVVKRVTITGISTGCAIHSKRDAAGRMIVGEDGTGQPVDFVSLGNNHHAAVYVDEKGDLHVNMVSFLEAVERVAQKMPVIDKDYKHEEGWRFLYSMKMNEYFVFPNLETGFAPDEIDLMDLDNRVAISRNLYRVQKLANGDYCFRHHLETTVEGDKALKGYAFKRITSDNGLKGIVKVRINHLGEIVDVGEY